MILAWSSLFSPSEWDFYLCSFILGAYVSYTVQSKTGDWFLSIGVGTATVGLTAVVVIGFGLWILLHHTKFGAIVRAGVDNRWMVAALGINIHRIFTLTFLLGGLLAG